MVKLKKITEIIPAIKEHVVMRDYTTFKVGGVADYFYEAKTIEDLTRVVKVAIEHKIPFFILGAGSNILFSDYGFPGLVIKNSTSNIAVMKEKSQIIADSGVMLSRLIMSAVANNLSGLEFIYGVPGTVGGAIYSNAGAFGWAIGDFVKNVTLLVFDPKEEIPQSMQIVQYEGAWLEFSYRESKLKRLKSKSIPKGKPVILSAKFQLSQNQKDEIMQKLNSYKQKREQSQPVGMSAGCVFKNPIPQELKNITGRGTRGMPDLPKERRAGFMLAHAGAKNLKNGDAEVSPKHANFIINKGNARATEIRTLIESMRERVSEKFNVDLDEEIEYIGQW